MQTEKEYYVSREIGPVRSESTGEYSLPDYNGDVKRVLIVKPKLFPEGRFNTCDSLEYSGTVGYDVVYLDSENVVTHAEFKTDYEGALKVNADLYVDSDVKTSIVGCNLRLVGPRKLSVKAILDTEIRLKEKKSYDIEGDAFDDYEPETMERTVSVFNSELLRGEEKSYSGQLHMIEGAIADEVEVLLSDCEIRVTDVETDDSGVQVHGNAYVTVLLRNGEEKPTVVSKEIALDERIDAAGILLDDRAECLFDLRELSSKIEPTEDGVCIGYSLKITPRIYSKGNADVRLVCDAYLKERGCDNEYSDFSYTEYIDTLRCEDTFDTSALLSELGVDSVDEIIWCEACAKAESCDFEDDCLKINGEIRFSGIACQVSEDSEPVYFPIRISAPFTQNVNHNCQIHANMQANCHSFVTDVKMICDGNEVVASCVIHSSATLTAKKNQRCLGRSNLTDARFDKDESVVTVYYPDPGETLFGIAKKFHTSVESIAETNRLSESVFANESDPLCSSGVGKLIIK